MKTTILTLFLLVTQLSFSQEYIVGTESIPTKQFLTDSQVYIYEDVEGDIPFEKVSHPDFKNNFTPRKKDHNYNESAIVWIRFSVQNSTTKRRELVFYSNDWDVQFFSLTNKTSNLFQDPQGVLVKTYNNKFYSGEDVDGKITDYLMPHTTKTYFIKTKGFLEELAFKDFDFVTISDREGADSRALFDLWSIGIYSGVLLLILFGNFYLMGTAFKKSYLLYGLYSCCHLFFFTGCYQIPTFSHLNGLFHLVCFCLSQPYSIFCSSIAI